MKEKFPVLFCILVCFLIFSVSGDDTDDSDSSSSNSDMDIMMRFLREPPLVTKNLTLNSTHQSLQIRYKVYLRNALIKEHTKWVITNEVPKAVGFKISIVDIDLDHREDSIRVYREQCRFKDSIHYDDDAPIVHLGETLDIEFYKSFTGLGKGFTIEVSSITEGEESPCPQETEISMDCNTERVFVRDSLDPEDRFGTYEHVWTIKSDDPDAKGFKVTFNKTKFNTWRDELKINGEDCAFEFTYENYDIRDQSQLPPLEITGSWVTVYLKVESLEYEEYEDLEFNVDLLDESSNTECSVCEFANPGDYCDDERCNCTATHSYCDQFRHACTCGAGSVYEDGKCVSEYVCNDNNRCISYHGARNQEGTTKSWNESKAICESEGARLVEITDEEFNAFVSTQEPGQFYAFYMGLVPNGGYENWFREDLPDGCPIIITKKQQWARFPCDLEIGFICEKLPE